MVLFCKKKNMLLFVQLRKSAGKSWNFVEGPGKVLELWCKKWKKSPGIRNFFGGNRENCIIWDRLQNSLLILGGFMQINWLLFSQKSSEKLLFSGNSRGNKSLLIHLNSLNIRSEIWRRTLAL